VCTSDAERWRIGRSIKQAARSVRTVHTTLRRRLRADRLAAASESAYCVRKNRVARPASAVTRHTNMTYNRTRAFVTNGQSCVRACVRACVRVYLQGSNWQRTRVTSIELYNNIYGIILILYSSMVTSCCLGRVASVPVVVLSHKLRYLNSCLVLISDLESSYSTT